MTNNTNPTTLRILNVVTAKYIEKFKQIHGDLYDYSNFTVNSSKDKGEIICKVHGPFLQAATNHAQGQGCKQCGLVITFSSRAKSHEEILEMFKKTHGDTYSYEKFKVPNMAEKGIIICKEHGEFLQSADAHSRGNGCKLCADAKRGSSYRKQPEEILEQFRKVHGDKYDYSKFSVSTMKDKGTIICKEHGEFLQTANSHSMGKGCKECANITIGRKLATSLQDIISKFQQVHSDKYDYSQFKVKNLSEKGVIVCSTHGPFLQVAGTHLNGANCPKCSNHEQALKRRKSYEDFMSKSIQVHGDSVIRDKVEYTQDTTVNSRILLECPTHGEFYQTVQGHLRGDRCKKCANNGISLAEKELLSELVQIRPDLTFVENHKIPTNRPNGKYSEIDIFIPELNIGIEYNGLYWHSEKTREDFRMRHTQKLQDATAVGIRLIQIFEDEYLQKKDIVLSRLKSILGIDTKIYARKTYATEISWAETKEFLDQNHIQGCGRGTPINYGLYTKGLDSQPDTLEAVMTFAKVPRQEAYELVRYCSVNTVVGGFSKLLKYFIVECSPIEIISYSDRRWSLGQVYAKNGFKLEGWTEPGYFWMHPSKAQFRLSRHKFQKHKLAEFLPIFDPSKSEVENCHANGYYRIFDAGHDKWILMV